LLYRKTKAFLVRAAETCQEQFCCSFEKLPACLTGAGKSCSVNSI
jgi:hypothetical protein